MTPVLRVVIPSVNLSEISLQGLVVRGLNSDYITDDPTENKTVPVQALYAARMNSGGQITVVLGKNVLLTPDHTYMGWPVPA